MAKLKLKQQKSNALNDKSFLVIDEKKIPVNTMWRNGPEMSHPREFALIDSLKLNQSAIFPSERMNIVNACRLRLHKSSQKRFIIRRVNPTHRRIWRVADGSIIGIGGRIAGVSPYKKTGKEKKVKPGTEPTQ